MPKTCELKTISEILEVVTPENVENFIKDFSAFLKFNLACKIVGGALGAEITDPEYKIFKWIDDGKNDVNIKIQVKN